MTAGCGLLIFTLAPNSIGFQDLGALLARQPAVAERAREHVIASPFGTIHAATFSLPRPIGTAIPHPPVYALANFDPVGIAGTIGSQPLGESNGVLRFPAVNRSTKRDSVLSRKRDPLPPLPPMLTIDPAPSADLGTARKPGDPDGRFDPYVDYEFATSPDTAATPDVELPYKDLPPANIAAAVPPKDRAARSDNRIYFGVDPLAAGVPGLSAWAPGEAPVVAAHALGDPDIKETALSAPVIDIGPGGQSIAAKGEVTGPQQRPFSPAERLALTGQARAKAEKCLANAVYFESRGEPVRGQIAVAQVVMNRVFAPFYPKDVCEVVYQNAHRHNACQFTFACDGIPDIVTEPDAWERAKRIARDMLDGKLWMPEVAKATHYHAYWVHPSWVGEMKRILKLGVHTFYRPLNWGDGADEPTWGDAKATAEAAKTL